jgi:hypothetical protein
MERPLFLYLKIFTACGGPLAGKMEAGRSVQEKEIHR